MCALSGVFSLSGFRGERHALRIIRKINNNAAVALDSRGKEAVVLGKGIGFPKVPYDLEDISVVERTFYDIDPRYLDMINTLPQEILLASADISEEAQVRLKTSLNPNLPLTLADHLNFAIERLRKGVNLGMPIAYDIRHLYPKEAELGTEALSILEEYTSVSLPSTEAINIAMHLINAEIENSELHSLIKVMEILDQVDTIVEKELSIKLDKDSYGYYRFGMHLRYLVQRLMSGTQSDNGGGFMLKTAAREYPQIYICALKVTDYLKRTWGWKCNDEELLYLMLHINRVREKATE